MTGVFRNAVFLTAICVNSFVFVHPQIPPLICTTSNNLLATATSLLPVLPQTNLCPASNIIPVCPPESEQKYRTADGSCNHRLNKGKANSAFVRFLSSAYQNGEEPVTRGKDGFPLPLATDVSRHIHTSKTVFQNLTLFAFFFGQFIDHDLTLTPSSTGTDGPIRCCNPDGSFPDPKLHKECNPLRINDTDNRFQQKCKSVTRSTPFKIAPGIQQIPREQGNANTAFLDLSHVYGSSLETQRNLRTNTSNGPGAHLRNSPGNRLPPNSNGGCFPEPDSFCFLADRKRKLAIVWSRSKVISALQSHFFKKLHQKGTKNQDGAEETMEGCQCSGQTFSTVQKVAENRDCVFGIGGCDPRVNENPGLALIHTIFLRFHNNVADRLLILLPGDSQEEIFQKTRKIVGAFWQKIVYGEWLPLIIGKTNMKICELNTEGRVNYSSIADPSIWNEFATVAFRFGHSMIPDGMTIAGKFVKFRELFLRVKYVITHYLELTKAMLSPSPDSQAQTVDRHVTGEATNNLFAPRFGEGLDLPALNIQRGRDHGLQRYNSYRKFFGLPQIKTFSEFGDAELEKNLSAIYGHPDNIDLFPGMLLEKSDSDSKGGPIFTNIMCEQFKVLQNADKHHYRTNHKPQALTDAQLVEVERKNFRHLICYTTPGLEYIQENPFLAHSDNNPNVPCDQLNEEFMKFNLWT